MMSAELPSPDCPPMRLRLLGENMIAFRTTSGAVGVMQNACPHRGASMFFGRNEEMGLRCVYHGWKFDVDGECVDMPSEPPESNFKSKVRITSYPSAEYGGLVWIYMGPRDKIPPLPQYDWTGRDLPNLKVYKWLQDSNYTQGIEGDLDTVHLNFLHRMFGNEGRGLFNPDLGPALEVKETDFGFVYGAKRLANDGQNYWRITTHVLPCFTSIPSPNFDGAGVFVVPQDDEHSWWFTISPPGRRPAAGEPVREHVVLKPGTFRQTRNQENDYLIDRDVQRWYNYTGLPGNRVQDSMATESMGAIYDRRNEHLGTTDQAIIFFRRQMLRVARDLEKGIEPYAASHGEAYRVRALDSIEAQPDFGALMQDHQADVLVPAR
jgi:phenylpropionate dioxygenase-like ring-hydroxylating dioxygenase large terminal subunit